MPKTTMKSISVRVHPQNKEAFNAAMRTHILFNLCTNFYCAKIRQAQKSSNQSLQNIIDEMLSGNAGNKSRGYLGWFSKDIKGIHESITGSINNEEAKSKPNQATIDRLHNLRKWFSDVDKENYLNSNFIFDVTDALNFKRKLEFNYSTFSMAAQRISSQTALTKLRREEIQKKKNTVEQEYQDHFYTSHWGLLDELESELASLYNIPQYFLTYGRIRGWYRIRKNWLQIETPNEEFLINSLNEYQKRNSRRFGDHALFELLAKPKYWSLWNGENASDCENDGYDFVSIRAQFNRDNRYLRGIGFSWPDPFIHPVWSQFGNRKANNSNQIPIKPANSFPTNFGTIINIPLLNDNFEFTDYSFKLSENCRITNNTIKVNGREFPFIVKGMKLVFDRKKLKRIFSTIDSNLKDKITNSINDIKTLIDIYTQLVKQVDLSFSGLFYISVEINLEDHANPYLEKGVADVFKEGNGNSAEWVLYKVKESKIKSVVDTNILGVDLGVRRSASWVSMNISNDFTDKSIELPDKTYALITKTGHITLPGESKKGILLREQDDKKAKKFNIMREELSEIISILNIQNKFLYYFRNGKKVPESLTKIMNEYNFKENESLLIVWKWFDSYLSNKRKEFRESIHSSKHEFSGGLSFERLELIEDFILFEKKFVSRVRLNDNGSSISPAKRRSYKHIKNWQDHLNRLKEDRCKKIAAEILKKAVDQNCKAIMLEDLSRYKTSAIRSKKENSRLMKWCHSRIYNYLKENALLFGVAVFRISCEYSSMFNPFTGAPGSRGNPDKTDPANKFEFRKGGKKIRFPSISKSSKEQYLEHDADINAAIVIGKRAFIGNTNAIRANLIKDAYVVQNKRSPFYGKKLIPINDSEFIFKEQYDKAENVIEFDQILPRKSITLFCDGTGLITKNWMLRDVFFDRLSQQLQKSG